MSAPVLGVIAILLLISLVSGLVLWWPPAGRRLSSLRIRMGLGFGRTALDLHNLVGVVSMALLAVALVTGIYLVEPRWIVGPLNVVLPTTELPDALASGAGETPIGFERAAGIAAAHFPDGRMWMIQFPQGASGTYHVFRPSPRDRTDMLPSRKLWLDQYTGAVLAEFGPHIYTNGDHVEQLLYPLHSGEVAGLLGRVLVSIAGWTPLVLFATGVIRWWQKQATSRTSRALFSLSSATPSGSS